MSVHVQQLAAVHAYVYTHGHVHCVDDCVQQTSAADEFPAAPAITPVPGELIVVDTQYTDGAGIRVGKVVSVDQATHTCLFRPFQCIFKQNHTVCIGAAWHHVPGGKC